MLDNFILITLGLDLKTVEGLISDTFTLLAGFVAIGIPLSVQIVEKAAHRFKSEYLIRHLSSWLWFTPTRLITASLVYILLALIAKYLISAISEGDYFYLYVFIWFLILYFFLLIIIIGMWYRHLLTTLQKRPEDILNDLS